MRTQITAIIVILALASCTRQVVDSWPDGSQRRIGTTVSGKQEGLWTYHHNGGSLAAQGHFAHDLQEGPWTYHHEDGSVAARGSYHKGLREGEWTWQRTDGGKERQGSYRADRQEGRWMTWDVDGTPRSAAWFSAGIADGPWWSRENGTIAAGIYRSGQAIGPWLGLDAPLPKDWQLESTAGTGATMHLLKDADGTIIARLLLAEDRPLLIEDRQRGLALAWHDDGRLALDSTGGSDVTRIAALLADWQQEQAPAPTPATIDPPVLDSTASSMSVATVMELPEPVIEEEVLQVPSGAVDLSPAPALPGFWTGAQERKAGTVLRLYQNGPEQADGYFPDPEPNPGNPAWHGKPLPKHRFLGSDGKVFDLSSFRDEKVAVVLLRGFAGQVCLYCAGQTAALIENHQRLEAAGVKVVVIYPGSPASVPGFLDAIRSLGSEPELPVCLDPGLVLVRELGLVGNLARPATVLLDGTGTVRWSHVAEDFTDRPSVDDILVAAAGLP